MEKSKTETEIVDSSSGGTINPAFEGLFHGISLKRIEESPMSEWIKCGVCSEICWKAQECSIHTCKSTFCKKCIEEHLKSKEGCPVCREKSKFVEVDARIKKIFTSLRIRCQNYPECPLEDLKYEELPFHFCDFDEVSCVNEGCTWRGQRKQREKHEEACEMKIVICPYKQFGCTTGIKRALVAEHRATCEWEQITCPCKCGLQGKKKDIIMHSESLCHKSILNCKYEDRGCKYTPMREYFQEHVDSCPFKPLQLVCKHTISTQEWEIHNKECLDIPLVCPQCGFTFTRGELATHLCVPFLLRKLKDSELIQNTFRVRCDELEKQVKSNAEINLQFQNLFVTESCQSCETPKIKGSLEECSSCKMKICCGKGCQECHANLCKKCTQKCPGCNIPFCTSCTAQFPRCSKCNISLCKSCISRGPKCYKCNSSLCGDCIRECSTCRIPSCLNCMKKCSRCFINPICTNCISKKSKCTKCKSPICPKCISRLPKCRNCHISFCTDCMKKCNQCKGKLCTACIKMCQMNKGMYNACQALFCTDCIANVCTSCRNESCSTCALSKFGSCEICANSLCLKCLVKCANCAKLLCKVCKGSNRCGFCQSYTTACKNNCFVRKECNRCGGEFNVCKKCEMNKNKCQKCRN